MRSEVRWQNRPVTRVQSRDIDELTRKTELSRAALMTIHSERARLEAASERKMLLLRRENELHLQMLKRAESARMNWWSEQKKIYRQKAEQGLLARIRCRCAWSAAAKAMAESEREERRLRRTHFEASLAAEQVAYDARQTERELAALREASEELAAEERTLVFRTRGLETRLKQLCGGRMLRLPSATVPAWRLYDMDDSKTGTA